MSLFFLLPAVFNGSTHFPVAGTVTVTDSGAGTHRIGIKLFSDGTMFKSISGPSDVQTRDWVAPDESGIGSEFEVECAKSSGSGIVLSNEDAGFFTISSSVIFVDETTDTGTNSWNGTVTVREIATPSNSEAWSLQLNTEL